MFAGLFLNPKNYKSVKVKKKIKYLDFIVYTDRKGVEADPKKVL